MTPGDGRFECLSDNFRIMGENGTETFSANKREVVVNRDALTVTGEGGTVFSGSVQTPVVRAESGNDLK